MTAFPFTVLQPTGSCMLQDTICTINFGFIPMDSTRNLWQCQEVIYIMAGATLQLSEPEEAREYTYTLVLKL